MTRSLFSRSYFQSNLCQHLELPHPLVYLSPGLQPTSSLTPSPACRVLPTATQSPPACNSVGGRLLEGGLGSSHSADICVCLHPPATHLALGKAHGQRSMLEELPRCSRRAASKEVHRARRVGSARIWGLASKMEEISRRPVYLKTECPPACIVVSAISGGSPAQSGEVLRRVG